MELKRLVSYFKAAKIRKTTMGTKQKQLFKDRTVIQNGRAKKT